MKKLISVLFAMILALSVMSVAASAEEADVTGDWYGSMHGLTISLTLNEDGTYVLGIADTDDASQEGSWELGDGAVILDPGSDSESVFAYDGETLVMSVYGEEIVFGHEGIEVFTPAEVAEDAELEDFAGSWEAAYISAYGYTASAEFFEDSVYHLSLILSIEGRTMKIQSARLNINGEIECKYEDGALCYDLLEESGEEGYFGSEEDISVKAEMLEDGMLALSLGLFGEEMTFYMVPAENAQQTAETETETA